MVATVTGESAQSRLSMPSMHTECVMPSPSSPDELRPQHWMWPSVRSAQVWLLVETIDAFVTPATGIIMRVSERPPVPSSASPFAPMHWTV